MANEYIVKIGTYALKGIAIAAEGLTIVYEVSIKGKTLDQIAEENPHFIIAQPEGKKPKSLETIK